MSGNIVEWANKDNGGLTPTARGGAFAWIMEYSKVSQIFNPDSGVRDDRLGFRLARNIGPKISISGTLPEATLNQAYAGYTFGAVGSTGDKTWSISEGTLPPGMSFSANGTLSGTPITAGTYTFVIRLESGGYWDEVEVELEVTAPLPNLLVNGSFEQPNVIATTSNLDAWITYGAGYSVNGPLNGLQNWTITSGEVDVMSATRLNEVAADGNQFLDLDGRMVGAIQQTIAVTSGARYTLTFNCARNSNASMRADVVSSTGATLATQTITANGTGEFPGSWDIFSLNFEANSSSVIIKFVSLQSAGSVNGVKLDNIRLYPTSYSEMVTVQGGTLPAGQASNQAGQVVQNLQIGKYEVVWKEWQDVRLYALANGYDIPSLGFGSGDAHPVYGASWFDILKWCNAKSQKEGLTPVYSVNGATYKTGQVVPEVNLSASGYRLPTMAEWEWAAKGGSESKGFIYSGSNNINDVAWYYGNSLNAEKSISYGSVANRGTWPVGTKLPNELGIYDMSGNVWEWCWDQYPGYSARRIRGGCWANDAEFATSENDYSNEPGNPDGYHILYGFRLVRKL
jgi:formylglycine-generating enzyme required for sulfatase activity